MDPERKYDCVLCDSWAHSPSNPETLHPRKLLTVTPHEVETALFLGFVWGKTSERLGMGLCQKHAIAVADAASRLEAAAKGKGGAVG
jgi:hypothetical protein